MILVFVQSLLELGECLIIAGLIILQVWNLALELWMYVPKIHNSSWINLNYIRKSDFEMKKYVKAEAAVISVYISSLS